MRRILLSIALALVGILADRVLLVFGDAYAVRGTDAFRLLLAGMALRLVALLAKQLGVATSAFPPIAVTKGNLGSSMCGATLLRSVIF